METQAIAYHLSANALRQLAIVVLVLDESKEFNRVKEIDIVFIQQTHPSDVGLRTVHIESKTVDQ